MVELKVIKNMLTIFLKVNCDLQFSRFMFFFKHYGLTLCHTTSRITYSRLERWCKANRCRSHYEQHELTLTSESLEILNDLNK